MSKKDNVDLICDIGELAGLFEKSHSLEDFLYTAVSTVAYHMRAAVCSIYLYEEEKEELVLSANQGLSDDAVGLRLALGEGIVGQAMEEMKSIVEGDGHNSSQFKFVPNIDEEKYQAFLAVPILRGLHRVGVIVVQDPKVNYFDRNDRKALQAISAQLATTIENAKLILDLHALQGKKEGSPVEESLSLEEAEGEFIPGTSASEGYAEGTAVTISSEHYDVLIAFDDENNPCTLEDFERALQETEDQLAELQRQTEEKLADVATLIFSAHLLILKDPEFSGSMLKLIHKGWSPQRAVTNVVNDYIHLFSKNKNPRLQEKVQDVKDLGHRLLLNLREHDEDHTADYSGQIIIAGDLMPSDILKYVAQKVEGIIIVHGGVTSHIAILARSLQVPLVYSDNKRLFEVWEGEEVILDAYQGNIFINPSEEVIQEYISFKKEKEEGSETYTVEPETHTQDGTRIRILSNINLLSDISVAKAMKAEGVGLYRSEFPFIIRTTFPSEEEQLNIYARILEGMSDREVTFRTLDIGGDKMLPYHSKEVESNPFLGLRAIRFSLENLPVFKVQLRAMLRASVERECRIMFPMISSLDEFYEAKEVVYQCIEELGKEGFQRNENPILGVMVEIPAAVEILDDLCREAGFIGIGTNDLVQYILAVDRTNERVAKFYTAHHPSVLRVLSRIIKTAKKYECDVSVCGDVVMDPRMMPFLIGTGLRKVSVDPRHIGKVQQVIKGLDLGKTEEYSQHLLSLTTIKEIDQALLQFSSEA